jgi:hypothetical protein
MNKILFVALVGLIAFAAAEKHECSCSNCIGATPGDKEVSNCDQNDGFAACQIYCALSGCNTATCTTTCFPADAKVMLENGTEIMMKDVEIGTRVRTGAKESSDVFMFSHKFEEAVYSFLELTTKSGNKLTVTGSHFIYINGVAAQAQTAKEGDFLTLANGEKSEVVAIQTVRKTGLYNPHTVHGDIVVDGVLTTTYTDALHPRLAHALLWPIRMAYNIMGAEFMTKLFDSESNVDLGGVVPNFARGN